MKLVVVIAVRANAARVLGEAGVRPARPKSLPGFKKTKQQPKYT